MSDFITVDDALAEVLARIPDTAVERIHLGLGAERRLAESVEAPWNSPRFDNSAMDGFALRWADLKSVPTTLEITGISAAGSPSSEVVTEGQAFRISTGAAVPSGADTVVPRELCDADTLEVTVKQRPKRGEGANIRRTGTYLKAGEAALSPGTRLGGAEIGLLASFGKPVVAVHARPRVAIISTGDELVELGEEPTSGQIVNSNAYMLEALVEANGGIPQVFPIVADRRKDTVATFVRAIASCDMVLSSGGVSVGDHDHVRSVVDELTGGMTFWKVKMKPGKPLAFGVAHLDTHAVPIIGLPGNPASSFVGFHLFVRPALEVAQGASPTDAPLPRIEASLAGPVRGSRGRRAYLAGRAIPTGHGITFEPRRNQSSGNPALFADANALGIVEEGREMLKEGAQIPIHLLQ